MRDAPGSAQQPKYQRIADLLRSAIDQGRHRSGERLPSEDVLAKEYGVSSPTINRAVELLKNDGYLVGRRGSGIFPQALQLLRRRGTPRPANEQWETETRIWPTADAQALDIDQVTLTEAKAPPRIAGVLGLQTGETVLLRTCRFLVNGRPVKIVRTYLPYELASGTSVERSDTAPGDMQAMLAELGHKPDHIREETRGRAPSSDDADQLSIPIGRFVLDTYRVAFDADRRAVGVEQTTMDSASFVLENEFDL